MSVKSIPPKMLLTEQEVAAMLGMSVHWLRRMRWQGGGIPFIRLNSQSKRGAVRYRYEDVEAHCALNLCRSTSSQG